MANNSADVGVIGGTGVYDPGLFSSKREIKVHTPYGETSDLVTIGEYAGVNVASQFPTSSSTLPKSASIRSTTAARSATFQLQTHSARNSETLQ